jgi:hypothetical protein
MKSVRYRFRCKQSCCGQSGGSAAWTPNAGIAGTAHVRETETERTSQSCDAERTTNRSARTRGEQANATAYPLLSVSVHVQSASLEVLKVDDAKRTFVRRSKKYRRRAIVFKRLLPAGRADAPSIARL